LSRFRKRKRKRKRDKDEDEDLGSSSNLPFGTTPSLLLLLFDFLLLYIF